MMERPTLIEDRRGAILAPVLAACAGLVITAVAKDRLARTDRYLLRGDAVAVAGGLPPWLDGRERAVLVPLLAQRPPVSIFDRGLPAAVAARCLESPWVARVVRVRRRLPASLEVACELRRPAGVVVCGDARIAVDAAGIVLEERSAIPVDVAPEIRIAGGYALAVRAPGQALDDDRVQEALALLRELEGRRRAAPLCELHLDAVAVGGEGAPRRAGAADLVIELRDGPRIRWGRSPASPLGVLDPPIDEKLEHLARVLRRYPGLHGLGEIDLRSRDPLVRPLG